VGPSCRSLPVLAGALLAALGCAPAAIDPSLKPADLVLPVRSPPAAPTLPSGVRVRALTLNIHGGQDASPAAIASLLSSLNLDVAGLEECPGEVAEAISGLAALPYRVGLEGPILLSKTPLTATAAVSLAAGRSFVHANTVIGGATFSVYVAHIGWNSEGDRQARELVDLHLRPDPERRLLMMGDFNDEHLSSQNDILEEVVEDVFTASGVYPGQRISWPATEFDGSEGSQLIDLFFYRREYPAIVLSADVLNVAPVLSDHKPAFTELLYPLDAPFTADPFGPRADPLAGLSFDPRSDANLLVDGGAEARGTGWTLGGGAITAAEREAQVPRTGSFLFTGSLNALEDGQYQSWGSQSFDLHGDAAAVDAGELSLDVAGWIATGFKLDVDGEIRSNVPRPYDDGEILVETFAEGGRLLSRATSQRRDTLKYYPWATSVPVPPGARLATYTFLAHHKTAGGPSNDVVFDDLYWAKATRPHGVLGGDLVVDGGAERGTLEGSAFRAQGFRAEKDGVALGLMLYPPWAHSGKGYFFAGGAVALEGRTPGGSELRQVLPLDDYLGEIDRELLTIHWGATLRTYRGDTPIELSLEVQEAEGRVWGTIALPSFQAPEWTTLESRLLVPRGARALAIVVKADVSRAGDAVFVDDLFAIPERR